MAVAADPSTVVALAPDRYALMDVASILAEVRSLANRGDLQTIVQRYGAIDDTPERDTWNSTELLYEIGRAFGMLGNEEKVERYLLRCAELAPRRAAVFHCAIGWYFQRKKKWTKALRWYDRALASFPTYHLCLFRRGYCLEKLHRPREAVEALARARVIWDEAPTEQRQRGRGVQVQVLFHLSRGYRDLGDFERAADALDACCALDRGNDPPTIRGEHTLVCRGELRLRQGDLDGALASFAEARDLDPDSSYVWERIGRVHELRGELEQAEAAYRRASSLPRGAFAFLALGRFYLATHDLPAAAKALSEAMGRVSAAEPLIRLELARLELACGRRRAALQQVERAIAYRREGGFADALRLVADLAEGLGRIADAHRYVEQLARLSPDDAATAARLGALAARLGDAEPPADEDPPLPRELSILEEAGCEAPPDARLEGVVDRFFAEKGFGFVHFDKGQQSIFFHVTQCEDGAEGIAPGTRVSFRIGHNPKKGKTQAEDLRRVD